MKDYTQILKDNKLKVTDCRLQMLDVFTSEKKAITHQQIENKLAKKHDRVTIYRTLNSFLEKNIIHKLSSPDNFGTYALCTVEDHCEGCKGKISHNHDQRHIHFVCENCKTTTCLNDTISKHLSLPDGFSYISSEITVLGLCDKCNKEN